MHLRTSLSLLLAAAASACMVQDETLGGTPTGAAANGGVAGGGSASGGGAAGTSNAAGATGSGGAGPGSVDPTAGADGGAAGGGQPGGSTNGGGANPNVDAGVATFPTTHPRIYLNASNMARLQATLAAKTPAATRFKTTVDTAVAGGDVYAFQPWNAALLGRLTGQASYCTWAVNAVDQDVVKEEGLIASGARAEVAADSYLYVGERIGDLALVYDWCFASTSAAQRQRWTAYANQAVWNVWHPAQATWGGHVFPWSGWSVDNPVNNYYFSFLRATMLLGLATRGENPQADDWIKKFRDEKIQAQLIPTYQSALVGGGSREGTGYGVAMAELFRLYDMWQATTGERLADKTTQARSSMTWMMHATVPTLDRIAPIGDHARDQTAALFDYHRAYLEALTGLYPNDALSRVVKDYLATCSVKEMGQGFMRYSDFLYDNPALTRKPLADLARTYHAKGTGYVFARSGWTADATWLEFTAGPYTESHAHHDQGQLLVYKRQWLAYDGNIDSSSGIVQDENVHNIVGLSRGGSTVAMQEGQGPATLKALRDDAELTHMAGDLRPAYPASAGVAKNEREVVFLKPNVIVVFDRVGGAAGQGALTKRWQLNTPIAPQVSGANAVIGAAPSNLVVMPITPSSAPNVAALPSVNGEVHAGHQVSWTLSGTGTEYFLMVLSLDGAATAATASDAAGQRGVTVSLAGGRTATVRFNEAGVGGNVELRTGGAVTKSVGLDATIATLPELAVP